MPESGWNLGVWFRLDQNGDGTKTISDYWLLAGKIFHLPGDALFIGVAEHLPGLAVFLELNADNLGGFISGFISLVVWFTVLVMLGSATT